MQEQPMRLVVLPGKRHGEFIARMNGPLTLGNISDFQEKVRTDKSPYLIIDLTQVPYIDSAGIGALVGVHVSRKKEGRRLALVGVNGHVRDALRTTNVEQFFSIFATQEEAEAASPQS
jgi:anti-sigma B factor antagonist